MIAPDFVTRGVAADDTLETLCEPARAAGYEIRLRFHDGMWEASLAEGFTVPSWFGYEPDHSATRESLEAALRVVLAEIPQETPHA